MPEDVVDLLQIVEVDQHERHGTSAAAGLRESAIEVCLEGAVVAQVREAVQERLVLESLEPGSRVRVRAPTICTQDDTPQVPRVGLEARQELTAGNPLVYTYRQQ